MMHTRPTTNLRLAKCPHTTVVATTDKRRILAMRRGDYFVPRQTTYGSNATHYIGYQVTVAFRCLSRPVTHTHCLCPLIQTVHSIVGYS